MLGRQKAVAPVWFSIGWLAPQILDRDVSGQIFILAAQRVTEPGPGARKALAGKAGVHRDAARPVGICPGRHAVDKGHVIHVPRHVGQQGRDHLAAPAGRGEGPRRFHQVSVFPLKSDLRFRARQRRAVKFLQHRLVVPQIDVRRRARTENLQHLFRLRGKMGWPRRGGGEFTDEQLRQGDTGESRRHLSEETSTSEAESEGGIPHAAE